MNSTPDQPSDPPAGAGRRELRSAAPVGTLVIDRGLLLRALGRTGAVLATIQAITGSSGLEDAVAYLKDVILGS